MPVPGVTTGDPITETWGDSVSSAITALEASDAAAYRPGGTDVAIADGGTGASTAAAARTALGVGSAQAPQFAGVAFPAVDVPSANVNTLDDYEEGTFTPTFSFGTPGTSTWGVTTALGWHTKIGNRVLFHYIYVATLAKGTGSGGLSLGGLPYNANAAASNNARYVAEASGWAKTGYSQITGVVNVGANTGVFRLQGSGIATVNLTAAEMSDGAVTIHGSGHYIV